MLFRRARTSRRRPRLAISLLAAFIVACQAAIAFAAVDPSAGPDTTIDSGPSGPTDTASPSFTFSSPQGLSSFACHLDAAPFEPCTSPQSLTDLSDGSHTFYARARDDAGHVDATPASRAFTVDTVAPAVTLDAGPDGPTSDPRPVFEFSSADESATFACSIDTGTPDLRPCSGEGSDQPPADLADGSYTFRVQASDAAGNSTTAAREFSVDIEGPTVSVDSGPTGPTGSTGIEGAVPDSVAKQGRHGRSSPKPVPAWYMTARGAKDLRRQARSNACAFARRQSNRTRVLLMDFGKSELRNHNWGAQLRTGPHFANQTILAALKAAAHSYRNHKRCYSRGSVRITYGNTNNSPGWMKPPNLREAGRRQAKMSKRLSRYQRRHHYGHEGVAVAGDIEPQWSRPKDSKALVDGATRGGKGGLFFNYGAASECPPEGKRCANHWDYRDLAKVSYGGVRRALPEIYRKVHVKQWSKVRRRWDRRHKSTFCFSGATATHGFPVAIRQSWKKLRAKNDCVRRELVNIQEN